MYLIPTLFCVYFYEKLNIIFMNFLRVMDVGLCAIFDEQFNCKVHLVFSIRISNSSWWPISPLFLYFVKMVCLYLKLLLHHPPPPWDCWPQVQLKMCEDSLAAIIFLMLTSLFSRILIGLASSQTLRKFLWTYSQSSIFRYFPDHKNGRKLMPNMMFLQMMREKQFSFVHLPKSWFLAYHVFLALKLTSLFSLMKKSFRGAWKMIAIFTC